MMMVWGFQPSTNGKDRNRLSRKKIAQKPSFKEILMTSEVLSGKRESIRRKARSGVKIR